MIGSYWISLTFHSVVHVSVLPNIPKSNMRYVEYLAHRRGLRAKVRSRTGADRQQSATRVCFDNIASRTSSAVRNRVRSIPGASRIDVATTAKPAGRSMWVVWIDNLSSCVTAVVPGDIGHELCPYFRSFVIVRCVVNPRTAYTAISTIL